MIHTDPPDEAPERDDAPGLVDPRNNHPAPEGLFSEGSGVSEIRPAPAPTDEGLTPQDDARGIVDPRSEAAGPDL
jgi:hypothetical protein